MSERDRPGSAFDRAAYERFKLPRRLGESIAAWDDPRFVPGVEATFMRPDDYVLGLVIEGRARAYPLWLIDYYHVVNDRIGERRFLVASCERCGSGSAFFAEPPGAQTREPLFRAGGLLDATLMMSDARSGSHWVHYEGRGLDRRAAGLHLPWIPVLHIEWADWCELHPDTEVWEPPDDPAHPDGRHGHGREEFFARPGMEPALLETMTRSLDGRYPENEMVLGIGDELRSTAYPLREVHREGGVVHDTSAEGPVVVFAGPRPDAITMAAFRPMLDGRTLAFERRGGAFVDAETGSRWTVEGEAVDGALAGERLQPVRSFYVRWHAWAGWHPGTGLFRCARDLPRFGQHGGDLGVSEVEPLLGRIAATGAEVLVEGPVVSQRRPRRSSASIAIRVDGDPLVVHAFASETAARDHEAVRGAWSSLPMRSRVLETRVRRFGRFVLEAAPEERFAEPAQIVPKPWSEVRWPAVLDASGPDADDIVDAIAAQDEPEVGLVDVVRALRLAGFEVIDVGLLPPGQLRVGSVDAVALTIDGDRFLLYLFEDDIAAKGYASIEPHARAFGRFVVRSTPDTMYVHQFYEILYAGDERITWSALLEDDRFAGVMAAAVAPREAPVADRGTVDVA